MFYCFKSLSEYSCIGYIASLFYVSLCYMNSVGLEKEKNKHSSFMCLSGSFSL